MSRDYHLEELRVALDPQDPRHVLPPAFPKSCKILDIGCGAGQTLIAAFHDRITFGIDIDIGALQTGSSLTSNVRFCCGRAEELPFADAQFDAVVARVSLAYTKIPASLREIRRVLRPGGTLWVTLHKFAIPWQAARHANWKGMIFFGYILVNSAFFHFVGRQFAFRGRNESFQTPSGMKRALYQNGFQDVTIEANPHFVILAR